MNEATILTILIFSNIVTLIALTYVLSRVSAQIAHFCQMMADLSSAIKLQTYRLENMK